MKISDYRLGFVGFGHMAQVICRAIEQSKLIPRSQISFVQRDTAKMRRNEQEYGVTAATIEQIARSSDLILFCVRPAQADLAMRDLMRAGVEPKLFVSILAGIKISFFQKYLGGDAQILRVMPNTPSSVGEGMSVFSYGQAAGPEFRSATNLLFGSIGQVIEVPENLMDISCAIGGSGPGFVFRLIEATAREGERHGLSYSKALQMAAQSFLGAAKMILKGASPDRLIEQIATPNGTTEAGFKAMNEVHIDKSFQSVLQASAKRSKEISEEYK